MTAIQHYSGSTADWEPEAWFILQSFSARAISACATTATTKKTAETLCDTCRLASPPHNSVHKRDFIAAHSNALLDM